MLITKKEREEFNTCIIKVAFYLLLWPFRSGVLAPWSICSLYFKNTYLTNFKMLKILKQKMHIHLHMLYVHKVIHDKSIYRVSCLKRQILILKLRHFI
jgi:hypothetical protein